MDETLKRTPLYDWHVAQGARMVPFAGWEMPVMYKSPIDEHHLTRRSAGLFDIDHMGQVEVTGPDAQAFVNNLVSWDIDQMAVWDAHYALMCYENGTIVDDVFVYHLPEAWYVVINASNREKDVAWMQQHAEGYDVTIDDVSDNTVMLALQGPNAFRLLDQMNPNSISDMPRFSAAMTSLKGIPVLVGRTGYTGEDGVELFYEAKHGLELWEAILSTGESAGIEVGPVGLAARDSLRFEPSFPLYGHEIDDTTTPLEARLSWACSFDTPFIGRDAILAQKEAGVPRKIVGFKLLDKGVPREGYDVAKDGEVVGKVVSGLYGPTIELYAGHAYVPSHLAKSGTEIEIMIRNKPKKAVIVKRPFYKPSYR